jgi:hypothetical protein
LAAGCTQSPAAQQHSNSVKVSRMDCPSHFSEFHPGIGAEVVPLWGAQVAVRQDHGAIGPEERDPILKGGE